MREESSHRVMTSSSSTRVTHGPASITTQRYVGAPMVSSTIPTSFYSVANGSPGVTTYTTTTCATSNDLGKGAASGKGSLRDKVLNAVTSPIETMQNMLSSATSSETSPAKTGKATSTFSSSTATSTRATESSSSRKVSVKTSSTHGPVRVTHTTQSSPFVGTNIAHPHMITHPHMTTQPHMITGTPTRYVSSGPVVTTTRGAPSYRTSSYATSHAATSFATPLRSPHMSLAPTLLSSPPLVSHPVLSSPLMYHTQPSLAAQSLMNPAVDYSALPGMPGVPAMPGMAPFFPAMHPNLNLQPDLFAGPMNPATHNANVHMSHDPSMMQGQQGQQGKQGSVASSSDHSNQVQLNGQQPNSQQPNSQQPNSQSQGQSQAAMGVWMNGNQGHSGEDEEPQRQQSVASAQKSLRQQSQQSSESKPAKATDEHTVSAPGQNIADGLVELSNGLMRSENWSTSGSYQINGLQCHGHFAIRDDTVVQLSNLFVGNAPFSLDSTTLNVDAEGQIVATHPNIRSHFAALPADAVAGLSVAELARRAGLSSADEVHVAVPGQMSVKLDYVIAEPENSDSNLERASSAEADKRTMSKELETQVVSMKLRTSGPACAKAQEESDAPNSHHEGQSEAETKQAASSEVYREGKPATTASNSALEDVLKLDGKAMSAEQMEQLLALSKSLNQVLQSARNQENTEEVKTENGEKA